MPYGLPNETPEQTKKMEKCVAECMKKSLKEKYPGRTHKESCIAICKASMMGTTRWAERRRKLSE